MFNVKICQLMTEKPLGTIHLRCESREPGHMLEERRMTFCCDYGVHTRETEIRMGHGLQTTEI